VASPFDPIAIALAVTRQLDALGIAHTIGGSIASSFAGEPRSTIDIDIVAAINEAHVPALVAQAPVLGVADLLTRALREGAEDQV
jgi:hypothetical protein